MSDAAFKMSPLGNVNPGAYIPLDRRVSLSRGLPLAERCQGAALFADISGFTPLTAVLARELGPQLGVEELSRALNSVYGVLIDQVHRRHGSIIVFSGDAITCWFNDDASVPNSENGGPPAPAVLRAVDCALDMQRAMGGFSHLQTPSGIMIPLAVKVAIASGPARRFTVGTPQIQMLEVLAGAITDRMAAAEQQAQRGDIVVSAEVVEQLVDQLVIQEWRVNALGQRFAVVSGLVCPPPEIPHPPELELSVDAVRAWLLPAVHERLRNGQGDFLAELRRAIPLFLKFSGPDYDEDEQASSKLDTYIRWVQRTLSRYEGYLLEFTVGDKGCYCYAVFGALMAHEDDPARAVAAALALSVLPAELNFISDTKIGISQGTMYVGSYGSIRRRTHGVIGREVNVAARLMSLAKPGQILVTGSIAHSVRSDFDIQGIGSHALKGYPDKVPIFAVCGRRTSPPLESGPQVSSASPLVGRQEELTLLAERLRELKEQRRSGCVIVEGEAGIGKTQLITSALRLAQYMGIRVLWGEAESIENGTLHYAWRQIFQQIFGEIVYNAEASAERHQQWKELALARLEEYGAEVMRLSPLLNAVLPLELPDNELTTYLSGEIRADNTNRLLARILQIRAQSEPLVVVLEDAHWLDSASWRLARELQRSVHPLLLMVGSRPPGEGQLNEYQELLQTAGAWHLRLGVLSLSDIEELLQHWLGVTEVPRAVIDLIHHQAEGHPFFSEELAYALRDAGIITIKDGRCTITASADDLQLMDLPNTIHGVITSRIDRLSTSTQLTLKVASVIGRVFLQRALYGIHPIEEERFHLTTHLAELEKLGITLVARLEPERSHAFKHAITQEVVYNQLLFAQRKQLHRHLAMWYEQIYADDLSPFYPLLAHHWLQVAEMAPREPGSGEKALEYLEKAGNQSLRAFANKEAVGFFSQALTLDRAMRGGVADTWAPPGAPRELVTAQHRRAHWARQLGQAYQALGRLPDSRKWLEQALFLMGFPLPGWKGKQSALMAGRLVWMSLGRFTEWRRSRSSERERERLLEVARIYLLLATLYYVLNESGLLLSGLLQSLILTERAGKSAELAEVYARLPVVLSLIPLRGAARHYARLAEESAQWADEPESLALAKARLSIYWSGEGAYEKVSVLSREAMAIFERLGDSTRWRESQVLLRRSAVSQGELALASKLGADFHDSAVHSQHKLHRFWGVGQLAWSELHAGRVDVAIELAQAALDELAQMHMADYLSEISIYAALTRARLHRGELSLAWQAAEAAARILPSSGRASLTSLDGYTAVAEVYFALWAAGDIQGAPQQLQEAARRNCQALMRFARFYPIAQPAAWRCQGELDWLEGRPAQAHRAWNKGLVLAEARRMPLEAALTHEAIGLALPPNDSARTGHLKSACETYHRIGSKHYLARAQARGVSPARGCQGA